MTWGRTKPMARGVSAAPAKVPKLEPKPPKGPKLVSCKNRECRARFAPEPAWIKVCSPECGVIVGLQVVAKRKAAKDKAERAETKRRKQAIKTIPELKAEAQIVFNQAMRLQDELAGHGCICCGKFPTAQALSQPGGAWDACHYRSRGSADHARYIEDNVWRGLKDCNTWGHKDYRGGLIARIGIKRVEALENNNATIKWTREFLEGIKTTYAARVKELKKQIDQKGE